MFLVLSVGSLSHLSCFPSLGDECCCPLKKAATVRPWSLLPQWLAAFWNMACSGRESFLAIALDEPCSSHSGVMNRTLGIITGLCSGAPCLTFCLQSSACISFGNSRNLRFCLQSGLFEQGIFSAILPFLLFWFQQVFVWTGLCWADEEVVFLWRQSSSRFILFEDSVLKLWSRLITCYVKAARSGGLVKSIHFYSFSRYFLSNYYVPYLILGIGDKALQTPVLLELIF